MTEPLEISGYVPRPWLALAAVAAVATVIVLGGAAGMAGPVAGEPADPPPSEGPTQSISNNRRPLGSAATSTTARATPTSGESTSDRSANLKRGPRPTAGAVAPGR